MYLFCRIKRRKVVIGDEIFASVLSKIISRNQIKSNSVYREQRDKHSHSAFLL